jgi:hypothetical protein
MSDLDELGLHPPTDNSRPVHVDADGRALPDPHAELGLSPGERDPNTIRAAWRQTMLDRPPESDPEGARAAREARDRLLDPTRILERELGLLHVPDPDAWDLPDLRGEAVRARLSPESRLLGQAVLYAMLEEHLWTRGFGDRVESVLAQLQK